MGRLVEVCFAIMMWALFGLLVYTLFLKPLFLGHF